MILGASITLNMSEQNPLSSSGVTCWTAFEISFGGILVGAGRREFHYGFYFEKGERSYTKNRAMKIC